MKKEKIAKERIVAGDVRLLTSLDYHSNKGKRTGNKKKVQDKDKQHETTWNNNYVMIRNKHI